MERAHPVLADVPGAAVTTRYFGGLDPGLDGGLVVLDSNSAVVLRTPMPTLVAGTGGSGKRALDTRAVVDLLAALGNDRAEGHLGHVLVALEEVQARPAACPSCGHCRAMLRGRRPMGGASAMSMLRNHGRLEGALTTLGAIHGLRYDLVHPKTWQSRICPGTGDTGQRAVAACRRLLPALDLLATPRCRVAHEGIADAGCLALYALRVLGNVQAGAPAGAC